MKSGTALGPIVMKMMMVVVVMLVLHSKIFANANQALSDEAYSVARIHSDTEAQTIIDLGLDAPLISPLTLPLT